MKYESIGRHIQQERKARKMTQSVLAEKASVSTKYISNIIYQQHRMWRKAAETRNIYRDCQRYWNGRKHTPVGCVRSVC